jgi:multidrug efflux pump subunit AcrA (membrane-fusion protein)
MIPRDSRLTRHPSCLTNGVHLTIQAQIRPTDIDSVHPGLAAKVYLIAFKTRTTPVLSGKLAYVSADTLIDQQTGTAYYDARIKIDNHELERLKQGHLYPGMPIQRRW